MSVNTAAYAALMEILASRQPIGARDLVSAMEGAGFNLTASRQVIQLAFERGSIRLDERMRVVIAERELAAA